MGVKKLKKMAIEYGVPIDLVNSIIVKYSEKCNIKNGVMGKYNHFQKSIDLMEIDDEYIFSTYIHELTHAMQHEELGTIRYILALSFLRHRLERDADNATLAAEKWIKERY